MLLLMMMMSMMMLLLLLLMHFTLVFFVSRPSHVRPTLVRRLHRRASSPTPMPQRHTPQPLHAPTTKHCNRYTLQPLHTAPPPQPPPPPLAHATSRPPPPPGTPQDTAVQDAEIRYNVRRLQHHSSIVLWNGGNEWQVLSSQSSQPHFGSAYSLTGQPRHIRLLCHARRR